MYFNTIQVTKRNKHKQVHREARLIQKLLMSQLSLLVLSNIKRIEHCYTLWHAASSIPPTNLRARGTFIVDLYYTVKLEQPKEEQPLSYQSRSTVLEKRRGLGSHSGTTPRHGLEPRNSSCIRHKFLQSQRKPLQQQVIQASQVNVY